ncbi:MAG: tripartite tricarboxylate transporter TctB family protein [Alphaproteobacteria bacterium]|nr:tripartite tricarboxylate transporter TctB family protein [Alphaproteobacteria bacterium]
MSSPEADPGADDRPVVGTRSVDIVLSLLLLAVAALLGWDSWRVGMSWAEDGPQAGYFPFYLSVLMGAASLYGLVTALVARHGDRPFVTRQQLTRVMQVFVPSLLFCVLTQVLGLYVASFLLIAGFMWWIGRLPVWVSLLTGFLFSLAMFVTFEIAFDVIMPKGPLEAAFGY